MMVFEVGAGTAGQRPRFLSENQSDLPWRPFDDWWNGAVYSTGTENIITRKELVLAVRSKHGGGHFDAELTCANYVDMRNGAGWTRMVADEELPPDPSHLLSIWAIAWELATSIYTYHQRRRSQLAGGG
jgi:hypothetical protein